MGACAFQASASTQASLPCNSLTVEVPARAQLGAEGKRLRPTMLLLLASALSSVGPPADFFLSVDLRPANIHPVRLLLRGTLLATPSRCWQGAGCEGAPLLCHFLSSLR